MSETKTTLQSRGEYFSQTPLFPPEGLKAFRQSIKEIGFPSAISLAILVAEQRTGISAYHLLRALPKGFLRLVTSEGDRQKLKDVREAFYQLDEGKGFGHLPPLQPEDPPQLEREKLVSLDREFLSFKECFLSHYHRHSDRWYHRLLGSFGALLYQFNGYQAPAVADPQLASEYAMGRNYFVDFLQTLPISEEEK